MNSVTTVEIYPNPARDELVVKGESMESIVLYDLTGRRIKEMVVRHEGEATLHVNDLNPGLYLVGIQSPSYNITKLVSVIR